MREQSLVSVLADARTVFLREGGVRLPLVAALRDVLDVSDEEGGLRPGGISPLGASPGEGPQDAGYERGNGGGGDEWRGHGRGDGPEDRSGRGEGYSQ